MQGNDFSFIPELHIFAHKDRYLVFHPGSFTLFRIGNDLSDTLRELQFNPDIKEVVDKYGVNEEDGVHP